MDILKQLFKTSELQLRLYLTLFFPSLFNRYSFPLLDRRQVLYLFFLKLSNLDVTFVFIWMWSVPKKLGVKLFLLCPILGESLKGDKACQRQSFHMLQLSAHIWHLLVTSAKAGKEVTTRPSRCNLSLSLRSPDMLAADWEGCFVEHWDSKCRLGGSSSVNRILGFRLWQWGDKKVTVRNPCQRQTTSWGQPSAEAALCFNSEADLWRVRAGWFKVSDVGGSTVVPYRVHATGLSCRSGGRVSH